MTAVSLNVGGGVRLIKPAKLYICTQNTTTQRGRTLCAWCVRQWFRTAEPLEERRYENWNTHTHTRVKSSTHQSTSWQSPSSRATPTTASFCLLFRSLAAISIDQAMIPPFKRPFHIGSSVQNEVYTINVNIISYRHFWIYGSCLQSDDVILGIPVISYKPKS